MPFEIFISYSRDDRELCDQVELLLEGIGYSVFVDRKLIPGQEWRRQLKDVLAQEGIKPYFVLLATRAAVARPVGVREEIELAEQNHLEVIALEFDAGAVKALLGTRKNQYIEGRRSGSRCVVDDGIENALRRALNARIKRKLDEFRTAAQAWIHSNDLLPEPSFWSDTWKSFFPARDKLSGRLASVVLTAGGGSGKSVLIAHCLKELLDQPTTYPLVLTEELLQGAIESIPQLLGARSDRELPTHLEALAKIHSQNVVFVVDGLDQIVIPGDPGQAKLIESLTLLVNSAPLIISCRKEYWDTVYAGRVSVQEKTVDKLDVGHVALLLPQKLYPNFDIENPLLQIPFFLGLTLKKANNWGTIPSTEVEFLQQVWTEAWDAGGETLPGDTGCQTILRNLAELQLEYLMYEVPRDTLKEKTGLGNKFDTGLRRLKDERFVVESSFALGEAALSVRLRHDLLDSFAMVQVLLDGPDCLKRCKRLCRHAEKDCGWTVMAMLVRALDHYGQEQFPQSERFQNLQQELFAEFLLILDRKQSSKEAMARAWAVTHVLKDCFPLLFPLICEALGGQPVASLTNKELACHRASRLGDSLTQEAASTLASAFMSLSLGTTKEGQLAVRILAQGLTKWDLKARFFDALAKYRTAAARSAIVEYGQLQLVKKNDERSLVYVARALKYFNEHSVHILLRAIYDDAQLESMIRRIAAESLNHLCPGSVRPLERDEAEIVEGLEPWEHKRNRYSDWNLVKDYAEYILAKIRENQSFSPKVLAALIKALEHDQIYVRRPVAMTLAYFDETAARDALLNELLEDVVPLEVREACIDGLKLQYQRCEGAKARQSFRGLLLLAARIASRAGATVTASDLGKLAFTRAGREDNWLADPLALEVIAPLPKNGAQVTCEILHPPSCPPCEPAVLEELRRSGPQDTGPDWEPKYRLTSLSYLPDQTLHVKLAPTTWKLGKGFHNAILLDPGRFRHVAAGSWIEPLPLGTAVLPGLAVVHAIVLTSDGKVLAAQRSAEVGYSPLHWSVSYEEQVTSKDFAPGSDLFATTARRGFLEEFGIAVPPDRSRTLSALIQLDQLNLGLVVLLQPEVTADEIRNRWCTEPRPTHHREANDVAFFDAHLDILKGLASGDRSLDSVLQPTSGERSSFELHPTSRIRCAMLARWLPEHLAD